MESIENIEHTTITTGGTRIHVASAGEGPAILFLHGFPELWYSWRHQIRALSARGYRCIAPDLRGYGDSDAPPSAEKYSALHIVGDLIGVLDELGVEKAFVVGHDWGAMIAWFLCLFRPDRVNALVNLGIPYFPRSPQNNFLDGFRAVYGDDFYIIRFQEPGVMERELAEVDTKTVLRKFYTSFGMTPLLIPKDTGFKGLKFPETLPSWLSDDYLDYCTAKFEKTGFTGGLNYYRAGKTWELTAPWAGAQIKVPAKVIFGEEESTYHFPGVKPYIESGLFKKDVPLLEEIVVLPGAAHFINQAKPDEITAHIYDFITKF